MAAPAVRRCADDVSAAALALSKRVGGLMLVVGVLEEGMGVLAVVMAAVAVQVRVCGVGMANAPA